MSDESHVTPSGTDEQPGVQHPPVLCRETILPKERSRGLTGVAIVCSMAGVASGLALAATLMAVQIADRPQSMSTCWQRAQVVREAPASQAVGWLGLEFVGRSDGAYVRRVFLGTAADAVGVEPGDVIRAVNGEPIDQPAELQQIIRNAGPGAQPELLIDRGESQLTLRPVLTELPHVVRARR